MNRFQRSWRLEQEHLLVPSPLWVFLKLTLANF